MHFQMVCNEVFMAFAREKVVAALNELGPDVSYAKANTWIRKQHGKDEGISDATFYNVRREIRAGKLNLSPEKPTVSDEVSVKSTPAQAVENQQLTFAELVKARRFCKEFGGRLKLLYALKCLGELSSS
jgi:hypothetical protein